ncbi:MAG TPA: hypothetical protein VIX15_17140 [Streptosporangiaceae bacterium]
MNPHLTAALADQRIRETLHQASRPHSRPPRPASRPRSQPPNRGRLRHRIGMTLVETGLRLLATAPALPGK